MKKNKITLKQLSAKSGYSISTISKALNDSSEISSDAKQTIRELAEHMGYRGAYSVAITQRTVAVLLPDVRNDFFAQVLNGLENQASENHYNLITCITNESYEKEVRYIQSLSRKGVDGFIIAAAEETQQKQRYDHFNNLLIQNIPLVMFDRVIDEVECDKIINDNQLSGAKAVQFLVDSGDRHICMTSTISSLSVGKLREEGIRKQLSHTPDSQLSVIRSSDLEAFKKRIQDALQYDQLQSVIALDQISGIITLNTAMVLGIRVPNDLQIICYSNGILSQYSYPQMTVLDQHAEELGRKTFVRMHNLIHNQDSIKVTRIHTLQSSLVFRGTTR